MSSFGSSVPGCSSLNQDLVIATIDHIAPLTKSVTLLSIHLKLVLFPNLVHSALIVKHKMHIGGYGPFTVYDNNITHIYHTSNDLTLCACCAIFMDTNPEPADRRANDSTTFQLLKVEN